MKIAIVPFRQRDAQLKRLLPKLRGHFDQIIVAEQARGKPFNRGAVKHAGVTDTLTDDDVIYFHDVDLMPGPDCPGYPDPPHNVVIHLYGHRHCLGGIVGMRVGTYRQTGGFCLTQWDWGGEDTQLQRDVEARGFAIDRSRFTQRFANDSVVMEMDAQGVPLPGCRARSLFMQQRSEQQQQQGDKQNCERFHSKYAILSFVGYGHLNKQPKTTHIIVA